MQASTKRTFAAALAGVWLLTSGCASQQELMDYQDEVRSLREERTALKKENRALRLENEALEVRLSEAGAPVAAPAQEQASPDYAELDALGIAYGNQGSDFVISIPSSISFGSGKAELTSQGKSALQVVARTLATDYGGATYWIEGHTDSDPIKKSSWGSNRELSSARAMAVLHYLVESCGIEDSSCVVVGHGEYQPIGSNSDDAGKAKNRRVEIVVHR